MDVILVSWNVEIVKHRIIQLFTGRNQKKYLNEKFFHVSIIGAQD
jgi:hypothetical protein